MEVTLAQMLAARDDRAARQTQLNRQWKLPQISFSMNIPGPVKDSPLIRRGFLAGLRALDQQLTGIKHRQVIQAPTGWEAAFVVDMEAGALKALTAAIEDTHPLGRLFDMDVLDESLHKLDRALVGGGSRNCIVCGAPGRGCASRRVHSVPQLQEAVRAILRNHFRASDAQAIGDRAVQSLIEEVETTPKPGLVDLRNNGSHTDMTPATFYASARALGPYFLRCAQIGQDTAQLPPEDTFPQLRAAGLAAEKAMYAATGGINTHKGAIFTLGVLCGAAGRLWSPEGCWNEQALCREVAAMTGSAMEEDYRAFTGATTGQQLYASAGVQGIRGEAARGLPSVLCIGLPAYRAGLDSGLSPNDAGAVALLHLIAQVEDTCLIRRGGFDGAREARAQVHALLPHPTAAQLEALDDWFIRRNLSPGGCADLLAATYFIHHLP